MGPWQVPSVYSVHQPADPRNRWCCRSPPWPLGAKGNSSPSSSTTLTHPPIHPAIIHPSIHPSCEAAVVTSALFICFDLIFSFFSGLTGLLIFSSGTLKALFLFCSCFQKPLQEPLVLVLGRSVTPTRLAPGSWRSSSGTRLERPNLSGLALKSFFPEMEAWGGDPAWGDPAGQNGLWSQSGPSGLVWSCWGGDTNQSLAVS